MKGRPPITKTAAREEYLATLPAKIQEQIHWGEGIRFADRYYRCDERRDIRTELLAAGGEHLAFWRGLVEGSGSIAMVRMTKLGWDAPNVRL